MADFNYAPVGLLAAAAVPVGFHRVHHRVQVGHGAHQRLAVASALLGFRLHQTAGITVPSNAEAVAGATVSMRFPLGPLGLPAPCRVLWDLDEPDRTGFAYGTLKGHPEQGEESFLVTIDPSEQVWFEVSALSRPARWFSRLGAPVARRVQAMITQRYLDAARRVAREAA